jgi:hypothetical protein
MFSEDGGRSWSDVKTFANVNDKADYPILIAYKNMPYLVWNTQQKGLQVIELSK